jgi:NAD(P)-dependent dehydrogenase (short-subunit alcohol dehydrogenase family)
MNDSVMETGLAGLTALVTGGASGIGEAIVGGLEAEGASVAVVDRAESASGTVRLRAELGDPETSDRVVGQAIAELGRLDLLVNCAAVARHEPATRLTPEAWEATLGSNLAACVWTCRAAARHMIARGSGSILIVGSTAIYTPAPRESLYRASKAALKAFAEVLAIELAPHAIRVNVLTPGAFATPLTAGMSDEQRSQLVAEIPLGREAVPDELVPTALLLLSDRLSPYTTGAEFVVDGGLRLRPLSFVSPDALRRLNEGL